MKLLEGSQTGLVTFMSWIRLTRILKEAGQLRASETVRGFKIVDGGLNVFIDYWDKDTDR